MTSDAVHDFLAARSAVLEPIGQGMEGRVVALDGERVAKEWFARPVADVRRLRSFTAALGGLGLPFAVPEVLEVHEVDGRAVSIERRVQGAPLEQAVAAGEVGVEEARAIVLDVLAALAAAGPLPAARELPVLDESRPLVGAQGFGPALAGLVARRAAGSEQLLSRTVDRFDAKVAALVDLLPTLDPGEEAVLHGDLFPGNVLVDPAGRTAVLDWGFLTTEGDPAFDAAVAAALFDMYGPDALEHEEALLAAVERRFGHDRRTLLLHRAAYSVATAAVYSADGSDGHFAWCVAALNRPDVTEALLG